jgi:hypothetical protein
MSVHLKKRERIVKGGRERSARPKTFTTLEAAQKYAAAAGHKKFEIKNLRPEEAKVGKFRVDVV